MAQVAWGQRHGCSVGEDLLIDGREVVVGTITGEIDGREVEGDGEVNEEDGAAAVR